jgi:hypothetical protein
MSTANHEFNTEVARKLKAMYERDLTRKKGARDEARKRKPQNGESPPPGEHIDPNAPLKGVLAKGDNYARRGYTYLKEQDGRGVYRNFSHPHLEEIRGMVREMAEFPGGPKQNFNPTYTQKHPYPWEAHHMLPGSAFYYTMKDGRPAFTYQQIRLILMSDYNINHGHNLIMLPGEDWAVPVHSLICHPSDHGAYTLRVMDAMRQVSDRLQKIIRRAASHGGLPEVCFTELKNLEDDFWDFLVALSRRIVQAKVAGVRYTDLDANHVRYESRDGSTQYEWGSLW